MEERRALFVLECGQEKARESLAAAQAIEAREFNSEWQQRLEDYGKLASRAVEEMHAKHKTSTEEFVATNRALASRPVRPVLGQPTRMCRAKCRGLM